MITFPLATIAAAAVAVATAAPAAAPAPTPTALREIGHTRSRALCSTVRDRVVPAINAMMANDALIDRGHTLFATMARDVAEGSNGSMEAHQQFLSQIVGRLDRNVRENDGRLSSDVSFPAKPATADDVEADTIQNELGQVSASQKKLLDLFSGTVETEALGRMQHERNTQMDATNGPNVGSLPTVTSTDQPVSYLGNAGLPEYVPDSALPTTASKLSLLHGNTVYDKLGNAVFYQQQTMRVQERLASLEVAAVLRDCLAPDPTQLPVTLPAPSPSPSP